MTDGRTYSPKLQRKVCQLDGQGEVVVRLATSWHVMKSVLQSDG